MGPELFLAVYGTLVAPLLVFAGNALHGAFKARGKRRALIQYLAGLPDELQVPLVMHYVEGAHTLAGNPADPPIEQLRHLGLISVGRGRGSYDAVDAYVMLRADVFDALPRLHRRCKRFRELVADYRRHLAEQEQDQR